MQHPPLGSADLGTGSVADDGHLDARWMPWIRLVLALGGVLIGSLFLVAATAADAGATTTDMPTASGSGAEPVEPVTSDVRVAFARRDTPRTPVSTDPDPLGSVIDEVAPVVAPAADAVAEAVAPALDAAAPVVEPIVDALAPVLEPIVDALAPAVCPLAGPIVEPLTPACDVVAPSSPTNDPTNVDGAVSGQVGASTVGSFGSRAGRGVESGSPARPGAAPSPAGAPGRAGGGGPDGGRGPGGGPGSGLGLALSAVGTGASGGAAQAIASSPTTLDAPASVGPIAPTPMHWAAGSGVRPDVSPD